VFQVLDHDETEFPFNEASVFEGLENPARRRIDPTRIREAYLKRFRSFMKEYDELLQSLEIPHSVVLTHEDPCTALSAFLLKRERLL
jgi:hypothetical protein